MKSIVALSLLSAAICAAEPPALPSDLNRVLSRVQSLGHGTPTEAEWAAAQADLDRLVGEAEQAGRWNDALEATLVKAMMMADMRRDPTAALAILKQARERYGSRQLPAMRKVYVREAQAYGALGDDAAVRRVMEAYKASPSYDPEFYPYVAHEGHNTPISIVRPGAEASDSTALTAMRVARQQSRFVAGSLFPAFTLTDASGRERSLENYRGKVLLVDFWVRGWTPWQRDLENLRNLHRRYQKSGFEVLGVCLEPGAQDVAEFAARQGLSWPQVPDGAALTRQLGIFGTSANFLINQEGQIIARDVRGADLATFVRRAVGE